MRRVRSNKSSNISLWPRSLSRSRASSPDGRNSSRVQDMHVTVAVRRTAVLQIFRDKRDAGVKALHTEGLEQDIASLRHDTEGLMERLNILTKASGDGGKEIRRFVEKDAAAKDAKEGNKDGTKGGSKGGSGGGDGKKQSKSARLEELNQMRLELDLKEIEVRQKTQELVKQEQTSATIQEELELARKLNGILQAELDRVKEETKLASGLCAQVGGF